MMTVKAVTKLLGDSRYRLSLFSLILTFVTALFVWSGYRIFMTNYIERQVVSAIENTRIVSNPQEKNTGESEDGSFFADFIEITADYQLMTIFENDIGGYYQSYYTTIVSLAKEQGISQEIKKVEHSGRVYYLALEKEKELSYLIFSEVTSEYNIMTVVSWFLITILSLALVVSSFVGWRLGWSIEEDKRRQKIFFENASHELKTPLMVIQGYADGFQFGLVEQEEACRTILKETSKMASLVDDIMLLSRLESGGLSLDKEVVSLEDLLDNVLYPISFQAKQKGISVISHIEAVNILADPLQLERALLNILSNALRYAESHIEVTANCRQICIANDGARLTKEATQQMFERFYIGAKGSTGIGMALTKEIIDRHGWKIEAAATKKGTSVTITMAD